MKRFISVFLAFLFVMSIAFTTAYADNEIQLVQALASECNVDLYLSDNLNESSLCVKVANNEATITECGTIYEEEVIARTTILIDISNSIPPVSRDKIIEFLEYQIENIAENEELRILTFGNEVNVLQEFTSDRYDLDKALEQVVYNGTQSAVYDAIYNTMPVLNLNEELPCFYRTLVITDGADYAAYGITKEELLMKLQSSTYPIDVVCVNKTKPENPNKELSALTRISNGRYYDIYPDSDIIQLFSDLSVKDYYWIRASIPYKYLDGSVRQVDVLDDGNHISFDMKMSVVDYAPTEESNVESSVTQEVIDETESISTTVENAYTSQGDGGKDDDFTSILLIVGAVVVLAIIIVIIVYFVSKKKTVVDNAATTDIERAIGDTELYQDYSDDEIYVIRISDAYDMSLSWTLEVTGEIIIGRANNCDITLTDKSVSHEQCKIVARAKGLAVQNLSRSNHTKLNGHNVNEETLLHSADTLHFGRITLRVEFIQKIGTAEKKTNTDDKYPPTDVLFD